MDTPKEQGLQAPIWEREFRKIANQIFRQELSELAIPPDHWPDVDDFDVFTKHIAIEPLALIADLGEEPLKTVEIGRSD